MLAGKIKAVHRVWLKENALKETEEKGSASDEADGEGDDDEAEEADEQSVSEADEPVVSLLSGKSDHVPAGEGLDDVDLLPPDPSSRPSPPVNKITAAKVKKSASKDLSQPEASSSKKAPAVAAAAEGAEEEEEPPARKSSKKKKKRSRAQASDEEGSSAPPGRKAPRLQLSIQGLLFA